MGTTGVIGVVGLGYVGLPLAVEFGKKVRTIGFDLSKEKVEAGLFVGVGTRLGSGCTSGHGVCGLSRLSPRSLAATAKFMAAGFLTVYVLRHAMG